MIVGILGGGQLGRMLALAGYPLGLQFRFLDASVEAPAAPLGELIVGDADNVCCLEQFAEGLAVATYEFENLPLSSVRFLHRRLAVLPGASALETTQDRLFEKEAFERLRIPAAPYAAITSASEIEAAVERTGLPGILKTRRFGYDGKGQAPVRELEDLQRAWAGMGGVPCILEGFVRFERELSILAVRSSLGETVFYPLVENVHRDGILRLSRAPAPGLTPALQSQAEDHASKLLDALDYVGVLAIEFFQTGETLVANEMAPRVHNSGHWTIEGAQTSQFENHLRAILGLPLGSPAARGPAAMLNLIGTVPERASVLGVQDAHLHLYDKSAKPGRKLGHVTVCAPNEEELSVRIAQLEAALPASE